MAEETSDLLDLDAANDGIAASTSDTLAKTLERAPYDSERARDKARENIAYVLLGILAFTIVATIVLCAWLVGPYDAQGNADRLVRVLNIVFGPIITLVGSATGFYFGAQTAGRVPTPGARP